MLLQKLLGMDRQCRTVESNLEKAKLPFAVKQIISVQQIPVILILAGDFCQIPVHVISSLTCNNKTPGYATKSDKKKSKIEWTNITKL